MAAIRRGREVLASLLFAAATSALAAGGSVDAGGVLYGAICFRCHGALTPLSSPAAAADTPARIKAAINPQATMGFLKFLSDQDLADIASYIARPGTTDLDRLLDWAEQVLLSDYLGAPDGPSRASAGYRYRYYPRPRIYLGSNDTHVFVLDAVSAQLTPLGTVRSFLAQLPSGR